MLDIIAHIIVFSTQINHQTNVKDNIPLPVCPSSAPSRPDGPAAPSHCSQTPSYASLHSKVELPLVLCSCMSEGGLRLLVAWKQGRKRVATCSDLGEDATSEVDLVLDEVELQSTQLRSGRK